MTDKERIAIDLAINHLKTIRNSIPTVSSIKDANAKHCLVDTWNLAMCALQTLQSIEEFKS